MQSGEGMLEKSQFRGTSFDFIGLPIGSGVDAKNMVPFTASPNANCCSVMEMVVSEKQGECRGEKPTSMEICSLVIFYVSEFEKNQKTTKFQQQIGQRKWKPPPENVYKINIDAAFKVATSHGGWGFVARNSMGEYLEGGCGNLRRAASSFQAEALAALYSLERIAHLGMSRIILETDATELVRGLTTTELDHSVDGCLLKQIRDFITSSFDYYIIQHCPRNCNKVADCLATYGASMVSSGSAVFLSQVPAFVSDQVYKDQVGADV